MQAENETDEVHLLKLGGFSIFKRQNDPATQDKRASRGREIRNKQTKGTDVGMDGGHCGRGDTE